MKYTTLREASRLQAEEAYLTKLHGPAPVCVFRDLRKSAGWSLQDLAIQCGLSTNALVRAEQGTYSNPLPSLMDFWLRKYPQFTELSLRTEYEDYQYYQRKRYFHYFGPHLTLPPSLEIQSHPFRYLRKHRPSKVDELPLPVGPDEVSRSLCIPVDTIRYWEKKFRSQQSVPKQVNAVLLKIGYTQSEVRALNEFYVQWRQVHNIKVTP